MLRRASGNRHCDAAGRRWPTRVAGCREGLIPLGEVEIAGDDGGSLLVTFSDQVMQIFVGG